MPIDGGEVKIVLQIRYMVVWMPVPSDLYRALG